MSIPQVRFTPVKQGCAPMLAVYTTGHTFIDVRPKWMIRWLDSGELQRLTGDNVAPAIVRQ